MTQHKEVASHNDVANAMRGIPPAQAAMMRTYLGREVILNAGGVHTGLVYVRAVDSRTNRLHITTSTGVRSVVPAAAVIWVGGPVDLKHSIFGPSA